MTQAELVALLRTPRGLAGLVALTLVGAVALAVFMALNLPFFEGTRKLVYAEPTGKTVLLAQKLEAGELTAVSGAQGRDLVRYYFAEDDALGDRSWMPARLAAVAPGAVVHEVELALLAGRTDQVEAALALVEAADLAAARPALTAARDRARSRRGEDALADQIDATLTRLPATPRDH